MKKLPLSPEDLWVRNWIAALGRQPSTGIRHALGHDCAVLSPFSKNLDLVLKTDAVVEGIHFTPSTPASLIGRKALARPLSDFAAAAATPRGGRVPRDVPAVIGPLPLLVGSYRWGRCQRKEGASMAADGGERRPSPRLR